MAEAMIGGAPAPSGKLRIAVEGCGHGTLHAIYASIEESCQTKGWDGVDLLIIGGDFQAVRNAHDLNVTAMPHKYQKMADFHEYYSGARTAPYLTIFIGGNHEASNHLFELYYGGWVAPNIYYLGAANVVNVGPLRIAGLSGIWKAYDYRKPHFERLPYNQEELTSIFHTRELDVRKLLSLRSQVDIGLSHDWPVDVVWDGHYRQLFRRKRDFEEDAVNRRLGSIAARECLDRLRPTYWFSAHLHCKYAAIINHEQEKEGNVEGGATAPEDGQATNGDRVQEGEKDFANINKPARRPQDQQQVSAWQVFHADAAKADADERAEVLQERQNRPGQNAPRPTSNYKFQETFKKVTADDSLNRTVESIGESEYDPRASSNVIPQVDGCSFSAPRKRRREGTESPEAQDEAPKSLSLGTNQVDGVGAASESAAHGGFSNPDAIDIDMSDDDEPSALARPGSKSSLNPQASAFTSSSIPSIAVPIPNGSFRKQDFNQFGQSQDSQDGGVNLNPNASSFRPGSTEPQAKLTQSVSVIARDRSIKSSNSSLNPSAVKFEPSSGSPESIKSATPPPVSVDDAADVKEEVVKKDDVEGELRAELASMSKSFAEPEPVEISPVMPFPEDIANKATQFLALDKCEPHKEFLQLLEISSITSPGKTVERPCKLEYDWVWLSILRTFASELELGGDPKDKIPNHRGEAFYHERIVEEEKWIKENVIGKGLLQVPENFTITAPVYDPEVHVDARDMPREFTNPQTTAFCKLIGIDNPFDITEEERNARMEAGARAESNWFKNRPQGNRGGRRGGRSGRGGRGGGRGGRGRGQN